MLMGWSIFWRYFVFQYVLTWLITSVLGPIYQDEVFIKFKPSVVFGVVSFLLLISLAASKRGLLYGIAGKAAEISLGQWRLFTYTISAFSILLAILNVIVANNFPTEDWVNYKLSIGGVFFFFCLIAGFFISQKTDEKKETVPTA